jgi:hypothetical protein
MFLLHHAVRYLNSHPIDVYYNLTVDSLHSPTILYRPFPSLILAFICPTAYIICLWQRVILASTIGLDSSVISRSNYLHETPISRWAHIKALTSIHHGCK